MRALKQKKGVTELVNLESVRVRLREWCLLECVNSEFVLEFKLGFVKASLNRSVRLSTRVSELRLYIQYIAQHFIYRLKGATSRFVYLEKFSLRFSSSSFAILVYLLHP